jgi:hypothetical protein
MHTAPYNQTTPLFARQAPATGFSYPWPPSQDSNPQKGFFSPDSPKAPGQDANTSAKPAGKDSQENASPKQETNAGKPLTQDEVTLSHAKPPENTDLSKNKAAQKPEQPPEKQNTDKQNEPKPEKDSPQSATFNQFLEARQPKGTNNQAAATTQNAAAFKTAANGKPAQVKPPAQTDDVADSSKWVAFYKMSFAVMGAGFINKFLFGSPLPVSIGLALAFAGAQSASAISLSRILTRNKDNQSPQKKEHTIALIWGVVSSCLALVEAGLNIAATKMPFLRKLGLSSKKDLSVLQKELLEKQRNGGLTGLSKACTTVQLKVLQGVGLLKKQTGSLKEKISRSFESAGRGTESGWLSAVGKKVGRFISKIADEKYRIPRGLVCAATLSFIGGYGESILATKLHDNLEKRKKAKAAQ